MIRHILFLIFLSCHVTGQLDVGDRILPEPAPPPAQNDDEPVDQEAVRSLTSRIQSRAIVPASEDHPSEKHPGKRYYERVARRLKSSPQQVRAMVSLSGAVRESVTLQNVLLNIRTSAGILPVKWSEIYRMEKKGSRFDFHLNSGDRFTGGLDKGDLYLERDDASQWIVAVSDVISLKVLKTEK